MSYAFVTVKLMNHAAKGITEKDFELARKIEEVVMWQPGAAEARRSKARRTTRVSSTSSTTDSPGRRRCPVTQCPQLGTGKGELALKGRKAPRKRRGTELALKASNRLSARLQWIALETSPNRALSTARRNGRAVRAGAAAPGLSRSCGVTRPPFRQLGL